MRGINKVQYGLVRDLVNGRLARYTNWTMPQVSPVCTLATNVTPHPNRQYEEAHGDSRKYFTIPATICLAFKFSFCQYLNILLIPVCVPASSICRGRTGGGRRGETGKLYRPTPTCIFVHFSKCISFHCKMYFAGDRHCTPTCNFPYISAFFATAKLY